jgi:hypothetical protein
VRRRPDTGKAGISMNFGFNSNVRVGDATYHVQTEDRGPSHPFLDTVVYLAGRVVYKRSASYQQFAKGMEPGALATKLHERLSQQHREVIAELEAGTLSLRGKEKARPAAKSAETHKGLELRVLNPKSCFAAGNVILEIELSDKNSKQRVGGATVAALLEQEKQRTPCVEAQTDDKGRAALKFPMPANVAEGSSLLVRATDGDRFGELRFRLKSKPRDKTPVTVSR